MSRQNHTTLWPELMAILLVRISILLLLVLVSLTISPDGAAFYAFMGIVFIITIPYSLFGAAGIYVSNAAAISTGTTRTP